MATICTKGCESNFGNCGNPYKRKILVTIVPTKVFKRTMYFNVDSGFGSAPDPVMIAGLKIKDFNITTAFGCYEITKGIKLTSVSNLYKLVLINDEIKDIRLEITRDEIRSSQLTMMHHKHP